MSSGGPDEADKTRRDQAGYLCVARLYGMAAEGAHGDAVRESWPELNVVHYPDYSRLIEELPDTDIFVGYSLRPEQLKVARKLKWVHPTAAGVMQLMYAEFRESGVLLTNPSGVSSVPMAEHTMGPMIALARNFPDSVRHQDRASWGQQDIRTSRST